MTFNEAAEFILSRPDASVETEFTVNLSTHSFCLFAKNYVEELIASGLNPGKDPKARRYKEIIIMIVEEIKAERINVKLNYLETNLPLFAL